MGSEEWIRQRGGHLIDVAQVLSREDAAARTSAARSVSAAGRWDVVVDISDSEPAVVREHLRSLGVAHDALVTIVWASTAYGVVLRFRDFVAFYDDWWCPSSDDVWVSAHNADWLLELDHEEILRFRRNAPCS